MYYPRYQLLHSAFRQVIDSYFPKNNSSKLYNALWFVDTGADCFKLQQHFSPTLPDLVIAQVHLNGGYISEGQGVY